MNASPDPRTLAAERCAEAAAAFVAVNESAAPGDPRRADAYRALQVAAFAWWVQSRANPHPPASGAEAATLFSQGAVDKNTCAARLAPDGATTET